MAHDVDGFDVSYTSRTSWKAHVSRNGSVVATAPVTWTKGTRKDPATGKWFQQVWFQNAGELAAVNGSTDAFLVAVAEAHDYATHPHAFKHFNCIYEVRPTGKQVDQHSIECEVLRRVTKASAI
ncbi:hypothetical protein ACQKQD_03665 [Methylobacterium sp. NPDC080182]|uniref:hypothetical protein n=1 Tax=Methylobacterium sp. NPDC080182 TaxID=3390590 RepID=UPI003CFF8C0D